jgi:prophage maintenance system killer protein
MENKRTALLTSLLFLGLNGFSLTVGPEWVEIMVSVADSTTGYSRSISWLRSKSKWGSTLR